ncbi:MAG: response regulator [Bacilli bacterium]|nr:response regulator [Bacilli bacterium]
MYYVSANDVVYSYGPSANFMYVVSVIYIIFILFCLFKNIKRIKSKKYIPIFAFIVLGTIVMIIQKLNPGLLLMTSMEIFVTFLMYFTIENPDMKMIEELNMAKEQAEKANHAKTDFLSSMSHEIRTPLNAIVGFSQALFEEDIPESAKEEVKDIMMASENLLELVNGILDISKIEANKLEIVNTEYALQKVLEDLVVLTKSRLGEKSIEFRTVFEETLPPVLYGDYARIKQIVLNLLTNSVKYTKDGYIEFRVSSVQKDGICRLIFSVEDSGIGIKNEKIDKLFTKFERFDLEQNITIEGTGLGLAITKKLIELMNGKIVVQSIYGKGSKFTVAIDQKIVKNPTKVIEEQSIKEGKIDAVGMKILIVDDNKINLKVAERLLRDYHVETISVTSGVECINLLAKKEPIDLILMDDMMPRMSGVETLQKLKENPNFSIPVIALTANAISGMKEKYLSEGFDDYLSKPIDKKELERVILKYQKN